MKIIQQLMSELNLSEGQVKAILLEKKRKKSRVLEHAMTDTVLHFGVVGDTHLCSKEERLDELTSFYEICRKMKVDTVLHAGDILDGWQVYRGQQSEVHTFGAKGQAQYVIDHYPKVKGITTYFITGN